MFELIMNISHLKSVHSVWFVLLICPTKLIICIFKRQHLSIFLYCKLKINHMNLPKMKNTYLFLAILFTLNLNAQIPDTLDVDLPWEIINIPECGATMGGGPYTTNDAVAISLQSDEYSTTGSGDCQVRTREWAIVDWHSAIVYYYTQVGIVKEEAATTCENEIYLHYDDFPTDLTPEDLLLDLNPSHSYSFSYDSPNANGFTITEDSEKSFVLYVYDHTDNTVCRTNVFLTQCEEEIELIFPETAEIEFNAEPYIELTLDMLGVSITYPCQTFSTKIRVKNQNNSLLKSFDIGKVVPVSIEVKFSDGSKYTKIVNVSVVGTKPDPKVMYIEEKTFSAGEEVDLEVWSEGVPGLVAWQLQIAFKDAEVKSIQTSETFENIPSNILEEGEVVRALWTPVNGLAINAESNATWFTITVVPTIDGGTFDIFNTDLDPWSLLAVEDDDYVHEYEAEFIFNIAPRDILNDAEDLISDELRMYPNPTTGILNMAGMSNTSLEIHASIFDVNGKLLLQKKIENNNPTLDISGLPSGILVMKLFDGTNTTTRKISKI